MGGGSYVGSWVDEKCRDSLFIGTGHFLFNRIMHLITCLDD